MYTTSDKQMLAGVTWVRSWAYCTSHVIVCVGSSSLLLSPFAARVTYVGWSPPGALKPVQFVVSIMIVMVWSGQRTRHRQRSQ